MFADTEHWHCVVVEYNQLRSISIAIMWQVGNSPVSELEAKSRDSEGSIMLLTLAVCFKPCKNNKSQALGSAMGVGSLRYL